MGDGSGAINEILKPGYTKCKCKLGKRGKFKGETVGEGNTIMVLERCESQKLKIV